MLKASKKITKRLKSKLNKLHSSIKKFFKKKEKPILYIVIGVLLLIISFNYFWQKRILSFNKIPETSQVAVRKDVPVNIKITSLNIDIPVEESQIIGGQWQIASSGASHLDISSRPGEGKNIVIYGHNKKIIFGSLPWAKIGEKVTLINSSGKEYIYEIKDKITVNPDRVDLLYPGEKEELTIYTCTGAFDSKRLVIKAAPIKD